MTCPDFIFKMVTFYTEEGCKTMQPGQSIEGRKDMALEVNLFYQHFQVCSEERGKDFGVGSMIATCNENSVRTHFYNTVDCTGDEVEVPNSWGGSSIVLFNECYETGGHWIIFEPNDPPTEATIQIEESPSSEPVLDAQNFI